MNRKVIARKKLGAIELVRYEGDPTHRWYRLTPPTAAEKGRWRKLREQAETETAELWKQEGANRLKEICQQIKQARLITGMSLDDLAAVSMIQKSALSRLESGKNPNPSIMTIHRIAHALGRKLSVQFNGNKK